MRNRILAHLYQPSKDKVSAPPAETSSEKVETEPKVAAESVIFEFKEEFAFCDD